MIFLKEFLEKVDFKRKISRRQKSVKNFPGGKKLTNKRPGILSESSAGGDLHEILISNQLGLLKRQHILIGSTLRENSNALRIVWVYFLSY